MDVSWLVWGWSLFVSWGVTVQQFMFFFNVLKENKDKCIELNVNVSYLVSHSYQNVADTLCTSDFTVAYPTIFICLHTVWFIGNVKSGYLWYEVAGDQCCVWSVSSLDLVTSKLSVSCFYFEFYEKKSRIECAFEIFCCRKVCCSWHYIYYPQNLISTIYIYKFLWKPISINLPLGDSLFYVTVIWTVVWFCIQVSLLCYRKLIIYQETLLKFTSSILWIQ